MSAALINHMKPYQPVFKVDCLNVNMYDVNKAFCRG